MNRLLRAITLAVLVAPLVPARTLDAPLAAGTDSRMQRPFEGLKPINGTRLFCRLMGKGEFLVVVHGGPGMGHDYLAEPFSTLASSHQMLFYDQRGNGRSDAFGADEKVTMDVMVEDLEGVRQAFGLDRMNLVGQSWGALIALNYVAKHPEKVRTLLLLEPAPGSTGFMGPAMANVRARLTEPERARLAVLGAHPDLAKDPSLFRELTAIQFKAYFHDPQRFDKRRYDYFDAERAAKSVASSRMFGSYWNSFNVDKLMPGVKCPTLLLRGDYDIVPMAAFERMKALIPLAEAVVLSDSGHFVHIEQPEAYFKAIRAFLARHAVQQGTAK